MLIDKLKNKMESTSKDRTPAQVVVQDVVAVKKGERVLIIANPQTNETVTRDGVLFKWDARLNDLYPYTE